MSSNLLLISQLVSDVLCSAHLERSRKMHADTGFYFSIKYSVFATGKMMNKSDKRYFPGALDYILPETEARFDLEQKKEIDSLAENRIVFRENFLKRMVERICRAHSKIQLKLDVLIDYDNEKTKLEIGELSLQAEIVQDALNASLLEVAKLVEGLSINFYTNMPSKLGPLFRRISKKGLISIFKEAHVCKQYEDARQFLFPMLKENEANVTREAFLDLQSRFDKDVDKLNAFRDKVIAHDDENRFSTHLLYSEYEDIFAKIVEILDAISIVATLQLNDWSSLEHFKEMSIQTKKWLRDELISSLERKTIS